MKKFISVFLIILFAISLVACNDNDVYVPTYEVLEDRRVTQSEAIKLAQEDVYVKRFIADMKWLKDYYISWGTCEAYTEGSTDSWKVYLRGNVSGYTDDYNMNYKSRESFSIIVEVSTNGIVGYPKNNFDE